MKGFNIMLIFDLIIAGVGVYLLYSYFLMKKEHEIPSSFVAEEQIKKCRDKDGFISYMLPRTLLFAVGSMASGILCFLADLKVLPLSKSAGSIFGVAMLFIFLAIWLIFSSSMKNAKIKYFASDLSM